MFDLKSIVRPNIWALKPYSSARDEYSGKEAHTFLDANESPYNNPYNRYPDPLQRELKQQIAVIKDVRPEQIFLGNGSDEAIDLVFRIFCTPGRDNIVTIEPSYGMYEVCADINNVECRKVLLNDHFDIEAERLLEVCNDCTKVIFLCSPNNPTGNTLNNDEIRTVLEQFDGIVVIDEAYGEFSSQPLWRPEIDKYPNLIVLNTLSKAWASAGIRLGMAFAQSDIIALFNKVKYPYNVNSLTQRQAKEIISRRPDIEDWVKLTIKERLSLMYAVNELDICLQVFPTEANFFLARFTDANRIYDYLVSQGVIVRNRSRVKLCDDCLRITIGSPQENTTLLSALRRYNINS
ncbi:MAG: histidinol-phosphate transaminase [Bacteroidaceae bacterium]|nr:histidinol-phosphate transaminase [Bacteroidaceae bacterium]